MKKNTIIWVVVVIIIALIAIYTIANTGNSTGAAVTNIPQMVGGC